MPEFIPGLELSELFYHEGLRPILDECFPGLSHSAGLIGRGSEVLGYDTAESTDHDWGPRVQLFLNEVDYARVGEKIAKEMSRELPREFRGYPTHFVVLPSGTAVAMETNSEGPVDHRIEVTTPRRFFKDILDIDPYEEISVLNWLTFSEQALLMATAGKVFNDGLNELKSIREKLAYYPEDIWRYMLASQWQRIGQEEAFVGRCGDTGDELGSRIIAARLVRDLMRLCFLMEKRYAPYPKWYGTAFSQLSCADELAPIFHSVMDAQFWRERESRLSRAYEIIARMHNGLEITDPMESTVSQFYDRPYTVINGDQFADAIQATIRDEKVKRLPKFVGSVDQFSDSTDILCSTRNRKRLKALYRS
jgi:hypothetical protein